MDMEKNRAKWTWKSSHSFASFAFAWQWGDVFFTISCLVSCDVWLCWDARNFALIVRPAIERLVRLGLGLGLRLGLGLGLGGLGLGLWLGLGLGLGLGSGGFRARVRFSKPESNPYSDPKHFKQSLQSVKWDLQTNCSMSKERWSLSLVHLQVEINILSPSFPLLLLLSPPLSSPFSPSWACKLWPF